MADPSTITRSASFSPGATHLLGSAIYILVYVFFFSFRKRRAYTSPPGKPGILPGTWFVICFVVDV